MLFVIKLNFSYYFRLEEESVAFATSYQKLVYFGHAVEMLLHHVLEDEAEHAIGTAQGNVIKY